MKYSVNVHYDYCATVEVEAQSNEEALNLAKEEADKLYTEELEYCGNIGSCIVSVS